MSNVAELEAYDLLEGLGLNAESWKILDSLNSIEQALTALNAPTSTLVKIRGPKSSFEAWMNALLTFSGTDAEIVKYQRMRKKAETHLNSFKRLVADLRALVKNDLNLNEVNSCLVDLRVADQDLRGVFPEIQTSQTRVRQAVENSQDEDSRVPAWARNVNTDNSVGDEGTTSPNADRRDTTQSPPPGLISSPASTQSYNGFTFTGHARSHLGNKYGRSGGGEAPGSFRRRESSMSFGHVEAGDNTITHAGNTYE